MKYAPVALIFWVVSANAVSVEEPNTVVYPRCTKIDPETYQRLPGYNVVMDIGNKFKIVSPNGNAVISLPLGQSEKDKNMYDASVGGVYFSRYHVQPDGNFLYSAWSEKAKVTVLCNGKSGERHFVDPVHFEN
ncbi:hypothetical protein C4Z22_002540 [Enterobacter hormaechei subsp. xiangfangensis]|nr:hypothetical protein C4Z22_002540 [Enterobacter hormaechei subsp. xiangfangensis]